MVEFCAGIFENALLHVRYIHLNIETKKYEQTCEPNSQLNCVEDEGEGWVPITEKIESR